MGRPKKNARGKTPSIDVMGIINKSMKKDIAKREIESDPKIWIKTGNDMLDLAISKGRGIPVGRITEFNGMQATGKSLICLHLIANAQKDGALVVLCDVENAYTTEFTELIGVDTRSDSFIYVPAGSTLEDIYLMMQNISTLMMTDFKGVFPYCLFILDSITQAPTRVEIKNETTSEGGYKTSKAALNAISFNQITDWCKIGNIAFVYTAQHRAVLGAMAFAEKSTASVGGYAPKFAASVRVKLKLMKKIKTSSEPKEEVGVQVSLTVDKTRFNHPHKKVISEIYYDSGFDNYNSWLNMVENYKIIKKTGAWYKIKKSDGEEISFQKKDWFDIITSDEKLREKIYNEIKEKFVNVVHKSKIDLGENEFDSEEDEI